MENKINEPQGDLKADFLRILEFKKQSFEILKLANSILIRDLNYSFKTIAENYTADSNKLKICLDEIKISLFILNGIKNHINVYLLIICLKKLKTHCKSILLMLKLKKTKDALKELQKTREQNYFFNTCEILAEIKSQFLANENRIENALNIQITTFCRV